MEKALKTPLCTTCPAPNIRQTNLVNIVEYLAAKEPDILVEFLECKTELKGVLY